MGFPSDYVSRVYAGVLGKIIGVYLGRPFEGWTYERITDALGEVWYYVHERLGKPLVVTDDDISGTFTFLRALADYDADPDLTPEQIGQTWLNYIVEDRAILWWGGMGMSTEHTAYLRLKQGIKAPLSGAMATNSRVVAEQIGAQIFIDGWGMICPGDPERAASFARRAASVSHDGEAIYAAQVIAAMEAQAFVCAEIPELIDTALALIPPDALIARLIRDVRQWHSEAPGDWRRTRELVAAHYGYDRYGGNCHVVPNHALIHLALWHGEGDFQKSLMIVNTCGWDTDCNSGNVGCLLGILRGLEGIMAGPDWRGPVADRLYLPTADGGRCITDAVRETYEIVNLARQLAGEPPLRPKEGARFHFTLPGSVQGFQPDEHPEARGVASVCHGSLPGDPSHPALCICYTHLARGRVARVATRTFLPPEAVKMPGYAVLACPTLYPGQTVRARVVSTDSVDCRLYVRFYDAQDTLEGYVGSPPVSLSPRQVHRFEWRVPDIPGGPIAEAGIELASDTGGSGTLYLDYLTWDGIPEVTFTRREGRIWRRAWVDAVDSWLEWGEPFRLVQNEGTGLLIQGTREWDDYEVSADVTPHMVAAAGLAGRVQGLRRYYALLLCRDNRARLVKALDGDNVLGEAEFPWEFGLTYQMSLRLLGTRIQAYVDGQLLFDVEDTVRPLTGGAVALVCTEGRTATQAVTVRPVA
ncbi:MAG: ADP-ribosylglycohydrolase family protein [Chloroherpetonaceae bacterium]|nr:ADP-ribosylglycohydrolase family protein [Chthonomonadaceae bacterium]MDW8209182.1 ADP-ribosylglycohydrolase family protein [Chloroherpetonaceae bacterium]